MSRSGYSEDCDDWDLIRWRGAVKSAIRGKRGQDLLRELATAMDAMPVKELVAEEFQSDGQFCALGVVGAARGMPVAHLVDAEREEVAKTLAKTFGIAEALAAEIMDVNDNSGHFYGRWALGNTRGEEAERADRERRWQKVRAWVAQQIKSAPL
jgi:hypothetical protein